MSSPPGKAAPKQTTGKPAPKQTTTLVLPTPEERLKKFGTLRVVKPTGTEVEEEWVAIQRQVFENWVKYYLSKRTPLVFDDLRKDFSDGTQLVALLEILSGKNISHNRVPRDKFQKIENVNIALQFMKDSQVVFRGYGAEDLVHATNPKVPLAIVWALLQKFQVNIGGKGVEDDLLKWVNERLSPYSQERADFQSPSWCDGVAISYLVNLYVPDCNLVEDLTTDNADNLTKAFLVAEKELGIPILIHPESLAACKVDDKSIKVYVSFFRLLEAKQDKKPEQITVKKPVPPVEKKPPPKPVESPRDDLNELLRENRHRIQVLNGKTTELKKKKAPKGPEYAMKQAKKTKRRIR